MTTKMRSIRTKLDDIPGTLPRSEVPDDVNLPNLRSMTIKLLENLKIEDLTTDSIWRDLLAFTGTLRTFFSSISVYKAYEELRQTIRPDTFASASGDPRIIRLRDGGGWVDIDFTFATHGTLPARCAGTVSVCHLQKGEWKIWCLRTWLEHFEGFANPDLLKTRQARINLDSDEERTINGDKNHFDYGAIIVGAGQAGLSVAGRLEALGVTYLVVERNATVGENWTNRYDSVRWHTTKEYGNLPFGQTYLPEDDLMLTGKMIGSGFKRWTERFGIAIRVGTYVENASYDRQKRLWHVPLISKHGSETVTARNLVLAIGSYAAEPHIPDWPGRDKYKGTAVHSAHYKNATRWAGGHGIVVGTANTAHDVAEDMVLAEFKSVTMVQRGRTHVFPGKWLHAAENVHYNTSMDTAVADRLTVSMPNKIARDLALRTVWRLIDENPEPFDALELAGFKLDRKGDVFDNIWYRFGGHYVDIGTSARIANGQIKMKGDSLIQEWTEKGLRFQDGSELSADFVVLCTGFDHDVRKITSKIVGPEAADAMDDYFGLDDEGEFRGVHKLAGFPNLYYHGGDVRQCRWYGRFVALSIQADVLGKPLPLFLRKP